MRGATSGRGERDGNRAASGCGGKRVADRGAGGRRERGLGSADERKVKEREGEGSAALYARMQ